MCQGTNTHVEAYSLSFDEAKGRKSYIVNIHIGEAVSFYLLSLNDTWFKVSKDTVKARSSEMKVPKPYT